MQAMAKQKETITSPGSENSPVTGSISLLVPKSAQRGDGIIQKFFVLAVIMFVFQFCLFAVRHGNSLIILSDCNNPALLPPKFNTSLAFPPPPPPPERRRTTTTPSSLLAGTNDSLSSLFRVENPLGWTDPWTGMQFYKYKEEIDRKLQAYHQQQDRRLDKAIPSCAQIPLYSGEFGYEVAGIIPWAYYVSQQRKRNRKECYGVKTEGRPGTKYLYYFSKEHQIKPSKPGVPQGKSHRLPKRSPFGESPHFGIEKFPRKGWLPPPYKDFFKREDKVTARALNNKPLLILSNKYTMEWNGGPVNHIPMDTLREILKVLSPNYRIVYNRFADSRLEDKLESQVHKKNRKSSNTTVQEPYGDKQMIRRFFPSVVLFEELSQNLDVDDVNLLMLSLGATAEKFVSVQGGNAVINSFFGGTNIIYCVKGPEVNYKSEHGGDFSYYHRFSNSTIKIARNPKELQNAVRKYIIV